MAVSAPPPPVLSPAESPLLGAYSPAPGSGGSECRMVEVHGVRVASFVLDGQELICLPQVFELFLKHLVGGLHTVYTKLKRLDITPVVCTVEQVRVLRGLGAIQPGVNRCKLITRRDFETLYQDCTNARETPSLWSISPLRAVKAGCANNNNGTRSRPGRPPKRSLGVAIQENARLLPHGVQSLLSPGLLSHTGLTAAAMAEAMKLQKMKLMAISSLHGSGSQNGTESENEELNSNAGGSESSWDKEKLQSPITTGGSQHVLGHVTLSGQSAIGGAHPLSPLQQNHLLSNRLDLPFMVMPHPLLPVSLPPASVAMAMNQMNHLNTIANMAAAAQMHSPLSRVGASVIKERIQDSPSPTPSIEDSQRPGSHASSHQSSSVSSSPSQLDNMPDRVNEIQIAIPIIKPTLEKVHLVGQTLPPGFPAPFLFADGLSSVETLLTNIQGLLKVAVDNARVQEKQIQQEKKELKMELCRERELRENLERQLTAELQSRATIQKRLKKEKKAKRKLQEALEFESKRREQVEQALKQATAGDGLRMLNDACIPEMETEHNGSQHDSPPMQENRSYIKPPIMY
ncbi:dachshund homolog 2 isoform X2 [Dendrobates tinctorius]|uniref:dachshund homolog 2 isoform X2 n=1 Tax=Dendrobates tinctorius TaxID=92724 RepID=UPI003CC95D60